jgi:uncharacterized RDD family membrane protein YckC
MPCPLCGDICRCSSDPYSAASPRWLPEADAPSSAVTSQASVDVQGTREPDSRLVPEGASRGSERAAAPEDTAAWRQEVAARLNRYQSRRKPRPPRYPSLRLHFEGEDPSHTANGGPTESCVFPQRMASNQALALDEFAARALTPVSEPPESGEAETALTEGLPAPDAANHAEPATAPVAGVTAKIIEFPRSWTPPPAPLDELAEPVITRLRILEAPEVVPPPPALGGITIEPARQPELEKRPGIDIPLQSAPLARRMLSALIDNLIIAAACALFGFIFWKLTAVRPPRLQIIGFSASLAILFWAAYQYLLVIYAGTTPGLRLVRLELTRFDGSPTGRRLRRWRVLASFLSALSLGMGYGWVFLDEDSLCWHDRITHTYLAPEK